MIKKLTNGATTTWPVWIPTVQSAMNAMPADTHRSEPFSLMFGRAWRRFEYAAIKNSDPTDFMKRQEFLVRTIHPILAQKGFERRQAARKRIEMSRKLISEISNGATVYARDVLRSGKWEVMYEGPYEVIGQDDKKAYVLRDPDGKILGRHFTVDQLKMATGVELKSDVFTVDRIMAHRGDNAHGFEYLVKWKGIPEQTWEPQENFIDWAVINRYWKQCNTGPAPGVSASRVSQPDVAQNRVNQDRSNPNSGYFGKHPFRIRMKGPSKV
jgi:hypothetical protein